MAGGCTAAPAWQQVELGELRASSLATVGDRVLVGGSSAGGPSLALLDGSSVPSALALAPDGPEAEAADLVSLSGHGEQLQALGTMISGAHSNPRWTVWDGSLSDGLTSHPQEFFTFGGHDAGPLLGIGWVADEPVILGSRTTATGARAALYQSTGTTWREDAARPDVLASTATSQLGFGQMATTADKLVIAGDEVLLTQPLRQTPVVWVGAPGGSWTRLEPSVPSTEGSGLARAQAAACPVQGEACWVAGWVHGQLLAWPVSAGDQPSVGPAEAPAGQSQTSAAGTTDPVPRLTFWDGRVVLAGNGSDASLYVRCESGWRSLPLPDRNGDGSPTVQPRQSSSQEPSAQTTVRSIAAAGGRLYILIDRTLWMIDRSPC